MNSLEVFKGIEKICRPLTKHLPVQIVSYARFYPDGKRLCLSNSPHFVQHFVDDHNFFRSVPNPTMNKNTNSMIRIADVNALIVTTNSTLKTLYQDMMADGVGIFKVQPPYSILLSKPGYYEEFSFFPSVHQIGAYEKLIANHDTLCHFMFYFLEKAHDLIKKCNRTSFSNVALLSGKDESIGDKCILEMKTKKYYFAKDGHSYLTKREAHCAYLLTRNLSSREAAEVMGISHRTVEDYIESIKLKAHITNKNKLQSFLCKTGFDRLIEFDTDQRLIIN